MPYVHGHAAGYLCNQKRSPVVDDIQLKFLNEM